MIIIMNHSDVAVARSWMPLFDSRPSSENRLRCPITCINGSEDLAVDAIDGWKVRSLLYVVATYMLFIYYDRDCCAA